MKINHWCIDTNVNLYAFSSSIKIKEIRRKRPKLVLCKEAEEELKTFLIFPCSAMNFNHKWTPGQWLRNI